MGRGSVAPDEAMVVSLPFAGIIRTGSRGLSPGDLSLHRKLPRDRMGGKIWLCAKTVKVEKRINKIFADECDVWAGR